MLRRLRIQPAVELGGRDAAVPDLVGIDDILHQPVKAIARLAGNRHGTDAARLRQKPLGLFAQIGQIGLRVFDQIPLVEGKHSGAAFADDEVDQLQILLFERDGAVEHDDDGFRKADGAQRIRDRELFQLLRHLGLAAHAGRIEHLDGAAAPVPFDRDAVAGDAGFRTGQQAVFTEEAVDERRLARIRAANDGDAQRLGLVINRLFVFFVFAARLAARQNDIRLRLIHLRRESGVFADCLDNGVTQVDHALAMFGGDRARVTKAEGKGVVETGIGTARFRLVGHQHHRLAATAQHFGQRLVGRRQARLGVHDKQRHIGFVNRRFRLRPHAALKRFRPGLLQTGGIDDGETQVDQLRLAGAAVTGDTRRVVHQRQFLSDQTVEKRGLADIGAPDYGDGEAH